MKVKLNNVRLTFPSLFETGTVKGEDTGKYSATFLFAPDSAAAKAMNDAMIAVAKEKWAAKAGEVYKGLKAGDKLCVHDGATKSEYEGYDGMLYVNASNKLRPPVVDGNRTPLTISDGKPYSGCYVNAIVELWAQDNKFGKRINASLQGVQFLRDGERLAGGSVASEDDFEEIPEAVDARSAFGDDTPIDAEEDPFK